MPQSLDQRYEILQDLARHRGRWTALGRDRLSGRTVVLKRSSHRQAVRELRCLLALPAGIAPQVLDAIWDGRRRLTLVMERVSGQPLDEAPRAVPESDVPALVQAIGQALVHLHRLGWIHADLKPSNVLFAEAEPGFTIRLLDLGSAINRFSGSADEPLGTPPYWSPELRRGWMLDGRADLYSLGVILRRVFPYLEGDRLWAPILAKLCQEQPADRYPNAVAFRDELARVFGLPPAPNRLPSFGAGPLRGRESGLSEVMRLVQAGPRARVLVQARPAGEGSAGPTA